MTISAADILRQMRAQHELKAQMNKYKLQGDYAKAKEVQEKLGAINFSNNTDSKSVNYAKAQQDYTAAYTALYDINGDGRISRKEYTMKELSGLDAEYKNEYDRLAAENKLSPDEIYDALDKKFGDKTIGAKDSGINIRNIGLKQMLTAERLDANNNNDLADEAAGYAKTMDALDGQIDGKINSSISEDKMKRTLEGFFNNQESTAEKNGEITKQQKMDIIAARDTYLTQDKEKISPEIMRLVDYETELVRSELRKNYGMEENRPKFGQYTSKPINTSPQIQTAGPIQTAQTPVQTAIGLKYGLAGINADYARIAQMGIAGTYASPFGFLGGGFYGAGNGIGSSGVVPSAKAGYSPFGGINTSGFTPSGNIRPGGSFNYGSVMLSTGLAGLAGGLCGIGLGGLSYPGGGNFNRNLAYSLGFGALTIAPLLIMPSFTKV